MDSASLSGIRRPEQAPYARLRRPIPAQEVAMLEAGQPVLVRDPRVATAAVLLARLTEIYVEDAPRIVELTVRTVLQLRAAKQTASPLEILAAAIHWKGPSTRHGNIPREFEHFSRLYLKARREGKDHAAAIDSIEAPPGPTPRPMPLCP
jgi:hypothetical protein